MSEHIDLTWKVVGILVAIIGVGSGVLSSVITWLLTGAKMRQEFPTKKDLINAIDSCKEKQSEICGMQMEKIKTDHAMCSGEVSKELKAQGRELEKQRELLEKGDREFTAIRLGMSEIFDALKIPGGRKKWLQIRDDVMNNRTK